MNHLDRMGSRNVPRSVSDSISVTDSIRFCLLDHIVRMWRYCSFLDVSVEFPREQCCLMAACFQGQLDQPAAKSMLCQLPDMTCPVMHHPVTKMGETRGKTSQGQHVWGDQSHERLKMSKSDFRIRSSSDSEAVI